MLIKYNERRKPFRVVTLLCTNLIISMFTVRRSLSTSFTHTLQEICFTHPLRCRCFTHPLRCRCFTHPLQESSLPLPPEGSGRIDACVKRALGCDGHRVDSYGHHGGNERAIGEAGCSCCVCCNPWLSRLASHWHPGAPKPLRPCTLSCSFA